MPIRHSEEFSALSPELRAVLGQTRGAAGHGEDGYVPDPVVPVVENTRPDIHKMLYPLYGSAHAHNVVGEVSDQENFGDE